MIKRLPDGLEKWLKVGGFFFVAGCIVGVIMGGIFL